MEFLKENLFVTKENAFLGKKRGAEIIKNQILDLEKSSCQINEVKNLDVFSNFKNLFKFDWDDEKLLRLKMSPCKNKLI
jgi:hypothetical protein